VDHFGPLYLLATTTANMKKSSILFGLLILLLPNLIGQNTNQQKFDALRHSSDWQEKFQDQCTEDWQSRWFLDGLRARVDNTKDGMVFSAGPVAGDHACHAVLWTKEIFRGDVKIEYQYTRTDTRTEWVNILYIQASGLSPYANDIYTWKDQRKIPYMKAYFQNMEALHISYAAYKKNNTDIDKDYVRARKYPVEPGEKFSTTTEIAPSSFQTGLFQPGETYQITVIKTANQLHFEVTGKDTTKLFSWELSDTQTVDVGRIGLRHMYTRSALYKDFKVYVKE